MNDSDGSRATQVELCREMDIGERARRRCQRVRWSDCGLVHHLFFAGHVGGSGFLFRLAQKIGAMTQAAFTDYQVVSRYFFVFAIDLGQLTTTLLTINKYWTPLVFHSRHPRRWLSALSFYCRVRDGVGQHGWKINQGYMRISPYYQRSTHLNLT